MEPDERGYADNCLRAHRLRVVFHLEQPAKHSRLFPRAFNLADVRQQLRQKIKPIDAHALVVEMRDLTKVGWTVTGCG